jgi:hypothetical protein
MEVLNLTSTVLNGRSKVVNVLLLAEINILIFIKKNRLVYKISKVSHYIIHPENSFLPKK